MITATKYPLGLLVLSCLLLVAGCATVPQPAAAPPDNHAAAEAAIRKADADWSAAAKPNQVDAWMAFYADDAVILPPNDKLANTKDAIRKSIGDLLALPGLTIHWQTTKAEAARSGEVGHSYGAYEFSFTGPKGKIVTEQGKYLEVWKQQPNGQWKCAVDMWSPDAPAAPPSK